MGPQELLNKLDRLLEDAKTGVFATTDSDGSPHMRWMTPTVLKYRPRDIFTFTIQGSDKLEHISSNCNVGWMIQSKDLSEIINIKGTACVVNNPSIKTEIAELLGHKLAVFWKVNSGKDEFVVIETVIKHATYFKPTQSIREEITFP